MLDLLFIEQSTVAVALFQPAGLAIVKRLAQRHFRLKLAQLLSLPTQPQPKPSTKRQNNI
jgi:hypothetical protein